MKWFLTVASLVALIGAGVALAESHGKTETDRSRTGMMHRGTMPMMGMMRGMMGGMTNGSMSMDDCAAMMRDMNADTSNKPNDQWRKGR